MFPSVTAASHRMQNFLGRMPLLSLGLASLLYQIANSYYQRSSGGSNRLCQAADERRQSHICPCLQTSSARQTGGTACILLPQGYVPILQHKYGGSEGTCATRPFQPAIEPYFQNHWAVQHQPPGHSSHRRGRPPRHRVRKTGRDSADDDHSGDYHAPRAVARAADLKGRGDRATRRRSGKSIPSVARQS